MPLRCEFNELQVAQCCASLNMFQLTDKTITSS